MQRDSDGFIDGLNLYAYVTNGPTIARDPSGLVVVSRIFRTFFDG